MTLPHSGCCMTTFSASYTVLKYIIVGTSPREFGVGGINSQPLISFSIWERNDCPCHDTSPLTCTCTHEKCVGLPPQSHRPRCLKHVFVLKHAGCATMSTWSAFGVSIVSALVYHVSYRGVICLKIDDAINAAAVHLFCGCWGLLAAGFTATDTARKDVGYPDGDSCTRSAQFTTNAFMAAMIMIWVREFSRTC